MKNVLRKFLYCIVCITAFYATCCWINYMGATQRATRCDGRDGQICNIMEHYGFPMNGDPFHEPTFMEIVKAPLKLKIQKR